MFVFLFKILVASILISFTSWLSIKKPNLAGFLIALPLSTMIALSFSYIEFGDKEKSIAFAKSIVVGVPLSLTFFIPFFLSKSLNIGFWLTFFTGIVFLICSFFIHKFITNYL